MIAKVKFVFKQSLIIKIFVVPDTELLCVDMVMASNSLYPVTAGHVNDSVMMIHSIMFTNEVPSFNM